MIARRWREPGSTVRGLFSEADPDLSDQSSFVRLVRAHLERDPELVRAWQSYSWDKRGSPSPYLDEGQVGFFDGERRDVAEYDDPAAACADFLFREATWVLRRERVPAP